MTLLNWELSPDSVVILSDTLSLGSENKLPRNFMTKIYPVPHLGGVITGTGISTVVEQFFLAANGSTVAKDFEHLSEFARDILRAIWTEIEEQLPANATTTIYTYGLTHAGKFGGFAYRSTSDFCVEVLPHGMAAKPAPNLEVLAGVKSLSDLAKLSLQQQADDRALPRAERVGIGGDLWLYTLGRAEDGSLTMSTNRLARMLHYDSDWELMLAQLPANEGQPHAAMLVADALGRI